MLLYCYYFCCFLIYFLDTRNLKMAQKTTNPLLNIKWSIEKMDPLRLGLVVPKVTQVKKWGNSSQDITVWAAFQWHGIWLGIDFRASSIYKQINDKSCFYERYQGPNTSSTSCLRKCKKGSKTRWIYQRKKSWKKKINERTFTLNDEIVLTSLQEKVVVV